MTNEIKSNQLNTGSDVLKRQRLMDMELEMDIIINFKLMIYQIKSNQLNSLIKNS